VRTASITVPLDKNPNVILIGTPGASKTHYSIALGIAAYMVGKSVLFANVSNLVIELKEAMSNLAMSYFRKKFERASLAILDELGYVSFNKAGAELLFNLISSRNVLDISRERGGRFEETMDWLNTSQQ